MDSKKLKILLVDDDVNLREIYADVFREEGFDVVEASDGLEGLEKTVAEKPDAVFTGIIMPRMDGFSLKETLAKNVATAEIPVFISSHLGRKEDQEKAEAMGFKGFFVQGMITPRRVVEKIRTYFSPRGYFLKFDPEALDAPAMSEELHFPKKYACPDCGEPMSLKVDLYDVVNRKFNAEFICPKCKKSF